MTTAESTPRWVTIWGPSAAALRMSSANRAFASCICHRRSMVLTGLTGLTIVIELNIATAAPSTAPSPLRGAQPVEAFLLLIAQGAVEILQRRPHGSHRPQHGSEPLLHGLDPSSRRARQFGRARGLEDVERLRGRLLEPVERAALRVGGLDRLRDLLDRPVGQSRGLTAAKVGAHGPLLAARARAARALRLSGRRVTAAGIAIGVTPEHALVDVVIGVQPERVIRIGVERVADEVVIGIGPEQRAEPADHDDRPMMMMMMMIPSETGEAALECRVRQRFPAEAGGGDLVGQDLVLQHATRARLAR